MKHKQKFSSRLVAMLLSLVMVLSVLPGAALAAPAAAVKHGMAQITMLNASKDKPSMCDVMFDAQAKLEQNGDSVTMQIKAAYPIPAFPKDGKDGTLLNFTVFYGGQQYVAASDITSKPLMTVKGDNPGFGLKKGDQITAQVLTLTLPAAALEEKTLDASAFVNVIMKMDVEFRISMDQITWDAVPEVPSFLFGTAGTELLPGEYDLPVALRHADKHEQDSMAAAAILGGKLEVQESGDSYINLKLGPVNAYGMVGWSESWKIYDEYGYESQLPDDPKTMTLQAAEIVSQDAEGHATEIRFKLPFTDKDGVYVTMFVPVVGAYPNAFLSLDFAAAVPEGEPVVEAPVITPESQTFLQGQSVEVTITAAAGEIYYTLDGTAPSAENGTRYEAPFTVSQTAEVKAVAVVDGHCSAAAEAVYTMLVPTVKSGKAPVQFGYDVTADVSVLEGVITNVVLDHNAEDYNVSYADDAKAMADGFVNLSAADRKAIQAVDTVSGATVTSEAYKAAVLDALGLGKAADFTFGSANIELKPGVYNVPISLRNASSHNNPSKAAGAFPAVGRLTVDEDGMAVLETAMQPVTIGPITDMAYDVKIYQGDDFYSEQVDATVLESMKKPETMPEPGKDVPTRISFRIPCNDWDGVYMNFKVDAMGGATPDGWLQLDYANARVPGEASVVTGQAKVDQFGKYTIYTEITVRDGVIDGVEIRADDFISETHRPENEAKVQQVKTALRNTWNGMAPVQENAGQIFKAIMDKQNPDDVIDSVSGATYSAKAVRDSIMSAFELEYQDEIINVPASVVPGVYEVEIGYYSDVVWHSLVEDPRTTALLTVNADKTMSLAVDTRSGTDREPLYILGFNGVYPDNDRTAQLTMDGCSYEMGLSVNDYEDEFFARGTQVVTHVQFPLLGGLSKTYTTNCRLYVPAMNKLDGEQSGIVFENGKFDVDVFAKIYWDSMKRIDDVDVSFSDVEEGYWAEEAIRYVVNRGLFEGTSATTFEPKKAMTRAMFIAVLGRLDGVDPNGSTETPFEDVSADSWFAPYVAWAAANGITTGTGSKTFEPGEKISRQEMAVFLYRYCAYAGIELKKVTDVRFADADEISGYAEAAVQAVAEAGLLKGLGGNLFAPGYDAQRAQVAALMMRFCETCLK